MTTPAAIHRRPLETCVRGCRWLPLLVPCGLGAESTSCGQQTYTKIMENRPRRLQNEVPEASGVSFLRPEGGVLRSPVPCCTRWALRASSGGAPEASRGRSRGVWGAFGDLSGASGDGPGTPRERHFGVRKRLRRRSGRRHRQWTLFRRCGHRVFVVLGLTLCLRLS